MPKIIVQADEARDDRALVTLTERVVALHLLDRHYANQLIERLGWAAADAEALESGSAISTEAFDTRPDPPRIESGSRSAPASRT